MLIETGKEAFARPWECPDALVLLPSLERRRLQCYLFLICADVAMIFLAFAGAGSLYMGTQGLRMGSLMAQLLLPCYLTVALYNGTYSLKSLQKAEYGAVRAVIALGLSSAVVVFIAFYTKSSEDFSRAVFTLSVAGAVILLPWGRFQARAVVSWRCGAQVLNELVIDDGGPALDLPQIRHLDAVRHGLSPSQTDPVALDRMGLILRNVDRVIVSCPPERRAAWALLLKGANIEGEVIDEAVIALGARGARQAGGQGLLLVSLGPLGLRARAMKRLLDIAISLGALVVFAPLLAVCAVMVKLEDGGPVLFVQRRMGRGNTFFKMYKLRSMAVARLDHDGSCSTARSDARVTRIGRFIRRTSIDELPQLFNVLAGDMSTSAGRSSSWRWTVIARPCLGALRRGRKPLSADEQDRAMLKDVPQSWQAALAPVLAGAGARQLADFLRAEEAAGKRIFPPAPLRLRALELTPLDAVRVVILGQDPYHGAGQAHGLAFSVPEGVKVPPSLANVYKELEADLGIARAAHGNLENWARQGVLLLNTSLSVEEARAGSHAAKGWSAVTDAIIAAVAAKTEPCVFMLWGNHARAKVQAVPGLMNGHHLVLTAAHPSPLSARAGFLGSRHFSRANAFLEAHGRSTIDWRV